jgi:hypothetical protein
MACKCDFQHRTLNNNNIILNQDFHSSEMPLCGVADMCLKISALVHGETSNQVHMPTHAMSPVQFKHFYRRNSRRANEHFNIQIRICVLFVYALGLALYHIAINRNEKVVANYL